MARQEWVQMRFFDKFGGSQLTSVTPDQVRQYEQLGWRRLNPVANEVPAAVLERPNPDVAQVLRSKRKE